VICRNLPNHEVRSKYLSYYGEYFCENEVIREESISEHENRNQDITLRTHDTCQMIWILEVPKHVVHHDVHDGGCSVTGLREVLRAMNMKFTLADALRPKNRIRRFIKST